jgi:type IV secretory pathway TraG/TraD family ATPase VirD4
VAYVLGLGTLAGVTAILAAGASGRVRWLDVGRWALRLLLTALIVTVLAVNLDVDALTGFISAGDWSVEAWLDLLPDALEFGVGLWLLVRVNQKLGVPRRRVATEFRVPWGLKVLLTGAGITALAYLVGFYLRLGDIPPDRLNLFTAFAVGLLQSSGAVLVFVAPVGTLIWLLMGPSKAGHGLYRGQFAGAEALHPLRVGKREEVPGDALLVGMVNQGTAEKPRMELLARRPGFGDQRELGHALFVYPSRKGKGLQLTTQGLFWRHSMLFIDPKGEFFGMLANRRRAMGQHVFVLDPSNPDQSNQYDPFADLGDSAESLRSAAKLILEPPPNTREPPYFAQRATNGLVAALRAAKLTNRPALAYLYEVKRRGLAHFIRTLAAVDDDIVTDNLTDFIGRHPSESSPEKLAADERLLTIWSTLNTRTADLLQPGVRAVTSGCNFRARDLVLNEKPVTLFLTFRESEIEATKAFLRLTTLALITDLIRIGDTRAHEIKHKLLLGFDEAGRVPVPRLYDLVSTVSSRGMSALIYVQDLSQLEAAYGREHAATIRSNCDTQVYYRPNDTLTARYVSERAGKTSVAWLDVTTDGWGNLERQSRTWKDRELITVSELMQLPEGRTVAFIGNLPPLVSERVDHRWLRDEVAAINQLNQQPIRLTRPSQPAVRYAPGNPPRTTATPPGKKEHVRTPGKQQPSASSRAAPPPEPPAASQHPDAPPAPGSTARKQRARARKRKEAETGQAGATQGNGKAQGRGETRTGEKRPRPTFKSGLEAAVAAFWERGGDISEIKPCMAAATGGGMPYEVYTDGKNEVAVCEVRGTGQYFIATFEELGLEAEGRRAQA